jgi:uncharacterized protein YecE (DUF72 family)
MRLFLAQAPASGDIARYSRRFDLMEVDAGRALPKAATLRRWRAEAPAEFAFSVVLPERIASLDGQPIDEPLLARALEAAELLGARFVVLRTPPSAHPSARTRRRLEQLVQRLLRDEWRVAWEPRGLWEDEDSEQTAQALGVHLVRDVSRSDAPADDVVYARLRALGGGGQVSSGAVERAVDELEGKREAYVVIEGSTAARAARMLRESLVGPQAMDGPDDEDYDVEAEDDEDEDD